MAYCLSFPTLKLEDEPRYGARLSVKGQAAPANDMPGRVAGVGKLTETGQDPLNFRVSATFRRELKTYAAAHDLKLNELLVRCFESYCKQQGD